MRVFLWALFALGLATLVYWGAFTALIYFRLGEFGIASRTWGLLMQSYVWVLQPLLGAGLIGVSLLLLFRRPGVPNQGSH